jgi:hypothetical protein
MLVIIQFYTKLYMLTDFGMYYNYISVTNKHINPPSFPLTRIVLQSKFTAFYLHKFTRFVPDVTRYLVCYQQ